MTDSSPRVLRWPSLALAAAATLAGLPGVSPGSVVPDAIVVRAQGRAPVLEGRADTAYQQALDESFRRALLEALLTLAPERQSPRDLETWQETILPRAGDFVAAWRILSLEQRSDFLTLEAEVEIWSEKLAQTVRSPLSSLAAQAVRLVVLADSLPLQDQAADEEVDAGRAAAVALEAEFARRGAVTVATAYRAPWEKGSGPSLEENRVALAAAAAKRLEADAVLILQLTRRAGGIMLAAQLVAVSSESTLGFSRLDVTLKQGEPLAESLGPAARRLAAALATQLSAARSAGTRAPLP